MSETRFLNRAQAAPAQAPGKGVGPSGGGAPGAKKSKKMLIIIVVVALVIVAAGVVGAFVLLGGKGDSAEGEGGSAAAAHSEPGTMVAVEPVNVNLAGGHYLRVGFTMEMDPKAFTGGGGHGGGGGPELALATYSTIEVFTGQDMNDLNTEEIRQEMRQKLVDQLNVLYHDAVMQVYFTDFITQ